MNTGTAPKKRGKASLFGIPHKTLVIALAVVILAALIVFVPAFLLVLAVFGLILYFFFFRFL